MISPGLAKRPELDVERPGGAVLMRDVPDLLGDRRGLDEEIVRGVWKHPPRPLEVDDRVDHHGGDVYALGPDLAGDRFREDPLRRFGRCKAREGSLPANRRGVAGGDDGTLSRRDHRRSEPSGKMQQRHRIDLEVSVEDLGIDLEEIPERATHGVVDQDCGRAEVGANRPEGPLERSLFGDVARIRARALDLPLERREPVAVPREHRDGVPAAREAPDDRRPRTGADPGDDHDWVRHAPSCSELLFGARETLVAASATGYAMDYGRHE